MFTITTKFTNAQNVTTTIATAQATSLVDAMLQANSAVDAQCVANNIVNADECFIYDALSDTQCYITINNTCEETDATIVVSITNNNAQDFVTQAQMLQAELQAFA